MVSTQRIEELKATLLEGAPWGASIEFLDSINSVEELEEFVPILKGSRYADLIEFYRENLTRWDNPQLEDWFKKDFPLLSARLDTPQKIRIFLRGADFRNVSAAIMGSVFEDIIRKHEVDGQKKVVYERYRGTNWCNALRIVYHTQIQAWTLTRLVLPGRTSSGVSSQQGLYIDWRTEKERKAAGEHW
jgi:hypothetical protein